ncbi:MAG: hypothetical protein IPP71_17815 [Bacteroidetes bacterium]|nr:hypothetical protein [Bacteroidota bacterium]
MDTLFELIYTDTNPGNTSLNVTTTYTDQLVNTADSSYTYIVQAVTTCNAELPLAQHVPHTSINLEGSIVNNAVYLQWNKYDGCSTTGYEIYRQDNLTGSFNSIAVLDETTDLYIDATVYCGMQVAYQVRATDLCGEGF